MKRVSILHLAALLTVAWYAEAATVEGGLRVDPNRPAGADPDGRVLLFTPKPVDLGSSRSHFDDSATPDLLMEPNFSPNSEVGDLDLTRQVMRDLGWPGGTLDVQISFADTAGEGFNDPDLGDARRAALEFAAGVWARILGSTVTVNIEAQFDAQTCDETGGTLATAGPRFVFFNFPGAEPNVWHPGPLAESISGQNLSASGDNVADVGITFNSGIDEECLGAGTGYYYGLDDNAPAGQISFARVALHEMGHGLGFLGLEDLATGELFRGSPDVFTTLTFDTQTNKHWDQMTDAERRRSVVRAGKVSFDGRRTTQRAENFLTGSAVIEIDVPRNLAGTYVVGPASFGRPLKRRRIQGELALVDDGSSKPTFACQPVINADQIQGKIAVIDRGDCQFVVKVKNAQDAGAIAAIIVHNEKGRPPGLGGSDDSIVIPSVRIGRKDGRRIKRRLRR